MLHYYINIINKIYFINIITSYIYNFVNYYAIKKINNIISDNDIDIVINGDRDHDIKINNPRCLYKIAFFDPMLTVGETYMAGDWSSKNLEKSLDAIYSSNIFETYDKKTSSFNLVTKIFNMQSIARSKQVGITHYDIGNDLYEAILDKNMQYSCGYWKNADNLDDAQLNKLDLLCRKLNLRDGERMRILDIGCGFGSLAKYISDKYENVEIVGLSISKEQIKYAEENYGANKGKIKILFEDYRIYCNDKSNAKQFDRVISVGMFEHVGYKNYETYFKSVLNVLKDDGLFVLHTIGENTSKTCTNIWIDKYIFPNGMLPSIQQLGESIEGKFVMEDWSNFGYYYSLTLESWLNRSEKFFQTTINLNYTTKFQRMWKLYLTSSKVNFKTRNVQLWQIVLSPKGINGVVERQS